MLTQISYLAPTYLPHTYYNKLVTFSSTASEEVSQPASQSLRSVSWLVADYVWCNENDTYYSTKEFEPRANETT